MAPSGRNPEFQEIRTEAQRSQRGELFTFAISARIPFETL
jgi:hypothetical protein